MKLLSVAPLAAVAHAGIIDVIQQRMNGQIWTETRDGFILDLSPGLKLTVTDYGFKGTLESSTDGGNSIDTDSYEVTGDRFEMTGKGFGVNSEKYMAVMSEIKDYDYVWGVSWSQGLSGLSLSLDKLVNLRFKSGFPRDGQVKLDGTADFGYSMQGSKASVNWDMDFEQSATGTSHLESAFSQWPMAYDVLAAPWEWSSNAKIEVANVNSCQKYAMNDFTGKCNVAFNGKFNRNGKVVNSAAAIKMTEKVMLLKWGPRNNQKLFFIHSEDNNGKMNNLREMQFWSFYYSARAMPWTQAVKTGKAELIMRLPAGAAFDQYVFPELLVKAQPFIKFFNACSKNLERCPYVIYYLDDFFAGFSDEFDCTSVFEASRIESDMFAAPLSQILSNGCSAMNDSIMEVMHCDQFDDAWGVMRNYVSKMASPQGKIFFDAKFGNIF